MTQTLYHFVSLEEHLRYLKAKKIYIYIYINQKVIIASKILFTYAVYVLYFL